MSNGTMRRTRAALMACLLTVAAWPALADDTGVPISLQVELLSRLLWYERGLQKSADKGLTALVVEKADDPESMRAAAQLVAQLDRIKLLGGKSVKCSRVTYQSADQVIRAAASQRAYLVYLSVGLGPAAAELKRPLAGLGVLTVSAVGHDAALGVVLGFELASGKPRILLNLEQARAQKLDFSAQLLRVVRVLP